MNEKLTNIVAEELAALKKFGLLLLGGLKEMIQFLLVGGLIAAPIIVGLVMLAHGFIVQDYRNWGWWVFCITLGYPAFRISTRLDSWIDKRFNRRGY
jgi:hypothetical protein